MKWLYFMTSILWLSIPLCSVEIQVDFKQAIEQELKAIQEAPKEKKSKQLERLAQLYLKDQNQEAAFEAFIESLDLATVPKDRVAFQPDELYKDALAIYLEGNIDHPQSSAKKLIEEFAPKFKALNKPSPLGYLIAIAYANLNRYAEFFDLFYETYLSYPDNFLAYKTKAVLHLKLMDRRRTEAEKNKERQAVLRNLEAALAIEPQDTTLYRFLISFSLPQNRAEQVRRCLNKILNDNILIPRSEIMFYVEACVESKENALAQRFIDRARQWYQTSRLLNAAQDFLNAHKN